MSEEMDLLKVEGLSDLVKFFDKTVPLSERGIIRSL